MASGSGREIETYRQREKREGENGEKGEEKERMRETYG